VRGLLRGWVVAVALKVVAEVPQVVLQVVLQVVVVGWRRWCLCWRRSCRLCLCG